MISTDKQDKQDKVVGAISVYNDLASQYNQLKLDYIMPINKIDRTMSVSIIYTRLSILCLKMLEHLEKMKEKQEKQEKQKKENALFVDVDDDGFFDGL